MTWLRSVGLTSLRRAGTAAAEGGTRCSDHISLIGVDGKNQTHDPTKAMQQTRIPLHCMS